MGAGSTDLMLITIMILRRVVVEKVCRVGTSYDAHVHTTHTQDSRQVGTWAPFKSTRVQFTLENLALLLLFCELQITGLTVDKLSRPGVFSYISRDGLL